MSTRPRAIELLAPARDLATGRVAVDCGADAVYIGGPGFGARRAAGNSPADVARLVEYARPFGVRVYATLNTLLSDNDLDEARRVACDLLGMHNESVDGLSTAGVDALIVQDMAFLRMGLKGVELHASTQTSNIEPGGVAFLGRAGFRRVILERALSLDEIAAIRKAVPESVELEAFIHGAICVGYSGRCFMSMASGGGRSGNRGDCSQPCRLAYDLVDSLGRVIVKGRHLLSVRDLDLSSHIGELLDAGVSSFKIEGRLKDAGYVRNVVSHYRRLIDIELAARPGLRRASVGVAVPDFVPDPARSFTRGGTDYFFRGPTGGVASFDTPKAMGEWIGRVGKTGCERTGNRFFVIDEPLKRLAPGDGICFFSGGELRGTNINRVVGDRLYPERGENIAPGIEICRNHDHTFVRALESSRMKRRIGVVARVVVGRSRVEVTFTDETGLAASVVCESTGTPARDPAKMEAVIRDEIARSGDTMFEVSGVEIVPATGDSDTGASGGLFFIPVSTLARMRREGLSRLHKARAALVPERHPATEDPDVRWPRTHLTGAENVTNRLAERFWRDHGVEEIERATELRGPGPGEAVMRTRYCIRREIGECLRRGSQLCDELHIERGRDRWRLGFDCGKCEMTIEKI